MLFVNRILHQTQSSYIIISFYVFYVGKINYYCLERGEVQLAPAVLQQDTRGR